MPKPQVTIFTDGGSQPNPGPGGYGILMLYPDGQQHAISGGEPDTTNNRMELTAACVALETLSEPYHVMLYTDSQYVKKGITEWIQGWVRKGWKDVKNPDLWQRLHTATKRHDIDWRWVRGHAGNQHNERVDQLATAARQQVVRTRGIVQPTTATFEPSAAPATTATKAADFDFVVYTATNYVNASKSGGWAVVIESTHTPDAPPVELSGSASKTSPYELAMLAAANALEAVPSPGSVQIHTDNETVQKGASTWVKGWRKNGWMTTQGKPVQHLLLWQRIDAAQHPRTVKWMLGTGVSPRADRLAVEASRTT
jgi:ribonuclease HI